MTIEMAWFAGIVEGEGYIGYHKSRHDARIEIEMTDEDVIARLALIAGVASYSHRSPRKPGWKTTYRLTVSGRKAEVLIIYILPLLGNRRRAKAETVLMQVYKDKFEKALDAA